MRARIGHAHGLQRLLAFISWTNCRTSILKTVLATTSALASGKTQFWIEMSGLAQTRSALEYFKKDSA